MICLTVLVISSFKGRKRDDLHTCFDDVKFQIKKERWSAYLFWWCQVSRGERKMICLTVMMISSFKRRKKDDTLTCFDDISLPVLTMSSFKRKMKERLLTCFDDICLPVFGNIKFQEEKKMIWLPVLTMSSFKRKKEDRLLTCFDDIKFQ